MAEPKKQTTKNTNQTKKSTKIKKSAPASNPGKRVRIGKLFRGKTQQEKREKQAIREKKRAAALVKQEEYYSTERYVSQEEALGPTVYNSQYLRFAAFYRIGRYVIMTMLVVFLIGMLNFFKDEITIENFRYLMRNVDFELRTELTEPGVISYDSSDRNTFAVYKDSLVQLSDRKFAIYDAGGRSSYVGNLSYTSPALCASEKYVLAYDREGGDYSLYTGFSQAHQASTDYPIADADITDSGVYVIASRSKSYTGVVSVYSASFRLMNQIQKNKYIAAVDLSDDGKNLLIASYSVGERGIVTELMTIAVDSDTPSLLFTVEGILPWNAAWLDEGRFVLICDEGVKFYDESGKLYSEYGFSEKNVIEYRVSSSPARVALVCRDESDTTGSHFYLLSPEGKPLIDRTFSTTVGEITFTGDSLILLSGSTAWRLSEDGAAERFDGTSTLQAVAAAGDILYLCTPTRVVVPDWKKQSH